MNKDVDSLFGVVWAGAFGTLVGINVWSESFVGFLKKFNAK